MDAPQPVEVAAVASRDYDRAKQADRALPRTAVLDRAKLTTIDPRKVEEAADYQEWLERAAKKTQFANFYRDGRLTSFSERL